MSIKNPSHFFFSLCDEKLDIPQFFSPSLSPVLPCPTLHHTHKKQQHLLAVHAARFPFHSAIDSHLLHLHQCPRFLPIHVSNICKQAQNVSFFAQTGPAKENKPAAPRILQPTPLLLP